MTIYFDMDGTIADLYGVPNWLAYLERNSALPYRAAKPMLNMAQLARQLNKLQQSGWQLGIISWTSRNGSWQYNNIVKATKQIWLYTHLKSVNWDTIHIIPYGTPKEQFANTDDILFDDEEQNRNNWHGKAYAPNEIMNVLKGLK